MKQMQIESLIRPNIRALKSYSSARNEFSGDASIFLDANESPFDNGYNRYPDPLQKKLKQAVAQLKACDPEQVFLGNGSDEAIDLIFRVFCEPYRDNVIAPDPTYGMYEVCAGINAVEYRKIKLRNDYSLDTEALLAAVDNNTKIIFLCSPNNPTGNLFNPVAVERVLQDFDGIVVVDEAYIDFAQSPGFLPELSRYPNLVVLQTFSKAWGHASIRLGMAFADSLIIGYFNKVKYPYNINNLTQQHALRMILTDKERVKEQIAQILSERTHLIHALVQLPVVKFIYPTAANFLLIKVSDADKIYHYLTQQGVIVRNRSKITLCEGCLRITVGTENENRLLVNALKSLK